jgi:hypothetical protein
MVIFVLSLGGCGGGGRGVEKQDEIDSWRLFHHIS